MNDLITIQNSLDSISMRIKALSMSFDSYIQMAFEEGGDDLPGRINAVARSIESLSQSMNQVDALVSLVCNEQSENQGSCLLH